MATIQGYNLEIINIYFISLRFIVAKFEQTARAKWIMMPFLLVFTRRSPVRIIFSGQKISPESKY